MPVLYTNATFHTADPSRPTARTLLVNDDGTVAALDPAASPASTTVIDLAGVHATPGVHDCHLHLFLLARQLRQADLSPARSVADVIDLLRAYAAANPNGWVRGRMLSQDALKEKRLPTRAELDAVSTARPVALLRVCMHAGSVNSAALALAGPDLAAHHDPSDPGHFSEDPLWNLLSLAQSDDPAELEDLALAGCRHLADRGFTSIGSMVETFPQVQTLLRLGSQGRLPLRVTFNPKAEDLDALVRHGMRPGHTEGRARLGAIKFFSDGSFGARTAYLHAPYTDDPGNVGKRTYDPSDLTRRFRAVHELGHQIAVHAIGDAALTDCIDALAPLCGTDNPLRHRIEHVTLATDADLARLVRHRIVCVAQPQFITSDDWLPQRLGEGRLPLTYRWAELLRAGAPVALSSDAPVEKADPVACLHAATAGAPWHARATFTPAEALRAYTHGSAYAERLDHTKGTLTPGQLADLTLFTAPPHLPQPAAPRPLPAPTA